MTETKYDPFTQNLVLIMTGRDLKNLEFPNQEQIVVECNDIYKHYISQYFANHFPEFDKADINNLDLSTTKNQNITLGLAQKIEILFSNSKLEDLTNLNSYLEQLNKLPFSSADFNADFFLKINSMTFNDETNLYNFLLFIEKLEPQMEQAEQVQKILTLNSNIIIKASSSEITSYFIYFISIN